jgi:Holliday junction resolvase RusA-like endonuclease
MDALVFSMSGDPRGKGRPRASVRGGFARMYTDAKTRTYEADVAAAVRAVMAGRAPLEGPLSVSLRVRLSPPKSMSKRQRAAVLSGEEPYFGRIDCDNAAKAILDAVSAVVSVSVRPSSSSSAKASSTNVPRVSLSHCPAGGAARRIVLALPR